MNIMKNTTQEKTQAMRGDFNFIVPAVVPSLIQGRDAEALYNEVSKTIKSGVWYDENSQTMKGSSTFLAARVDSAVRALGQGIRVATLADLSRPEIMGMIKDRFYSDTPAIVFRSTEDSFEPNEAIIKQLAPMIEQKAGNLKLPCLVTGFDVKPSKSREGYGLDLVARPDFAVLQDDRLSGKYDGKNFSTIDENGLPNFDKSGSRIWFARNQGISGLYLDGDLDLSSRYYDVGSLADSNDSGRVALVRDLSASAQKK